MRWNATLLRRSAVRTLAAVLLLPAVVLLGLASGANAITVYFQDAGLYGISELSALDAQAAGIPIISVPLTDLFLPDLDDIDRPSPQLGSWTDPPGASVLNPATGSTTWTWTNGGAAPLGNLWIMFRAYDPTDPTDPHYSPDNVGLEIGSGWGILALSDGVNTEYHPSFFLGDLLPGETGDIPLDYRIAQNLFSTNGGDKLVFPKLLVGGAFAPIPEPSAFLLLATGLASFAATRRSRC